MKTYSAEEKKTARDKLPRPVSDFLRSSTITGLYLGIIGKHRLNLRQAGTMSDIANTTLLGLEPEHAFETNVHQALPELDNAKTRELVADINDRVFKEARRRLQENVMEPEPPWDEEESGPRPKEGESIRPMSDDALDTLVEKERKGEWKPEPVEETSAPIGMAIEHLIQKTQTESTEGTQLSRIAMERLTNATQPSIAEQRLTSPATVKTEEVRIKPEPSGIQQVEIPKTEFKVEPNLPASNTTPPQTPTPPQAPRIYPGRVDPYREPIE